MRFEAIFRFHAVRRVLIGPGLVLAVRLSVHDSLLAIGLTNLDAGACTPEAPCAMWRLGVFLGVRTGMCVPQNDANRSHRDRILVPTVSQPAATRRQLLPVSVFCSSFPVAHMKDCSVGSVHPLRARSGINDWFGCAYFVQYQAIDRRNGWWPFRDRARR